MCQSQEVIFRSLLENGRRLFKHAMGCLSQIILVGRAALLPDGQCPVTGAHWGLGVKWWEEFLCDTGSHPAKTCTE